MLKEKKLSPIIYYGNELGVLHKSLNCKDSFDIAPDLSLMRDSSKKTERDSESDISGPLLD